MQDEAHNDHERKEDIEGKGDGIVRSPQVNGKGIPDITIHFRGLVVNQRGTNYCISDVSWVSLSADEELEFVPKQERYIMHGKPTAQWFLA